MHPVGKALLWAIGATIVVVAVDGFAHRPEPVDVTAQLHVARDDATTYQATVLAPPGLTKSGYEKILRGVYDANMRGRAGLVQVFDDAEAEKLAMCWTTRQTTVDEDSFCADHIVAQAVGADPQQR